MSESPFGSEITSEDVLEDLAFFDDWEDRYRYIIELGKKLPPMEAELKNETNLVKGCQSQVWISHNYDSSNDTLAFQVDSDAHIVRGLAAMVMAAFNNKTPQQVMDFDVQDYFGKSQLIQHLSPTRGNGLQSMVKTIQASASMHQQK